LGLGSPSSKDMAHCCNLSESPTVHKEEHMWGRRVEFCYQSMLMVRVEPKQHALNDEKKIFADEPNSRWHWFAKPAE